MSFPIPTDPVSAAFAGAVLLVQTADQVGQLVARLQDHQRTLQQARDDYKTSGDRMDGPTTPEATS